MERFRFTHKQNITIAKSRESIKGNIADYRAENREEIKGGR